jgi:hypothetical protein
MQRLSLYIVVFSTGLSTMLQVRNVALNFALSHPVALRETYRSSNNVLSCVNISHQAFEGTASVRPHCPAE